MTEYAAFLGIDWADKKHDVCLSDTTTGSAGLHERRAGARPAGE
jgi:hypothetical protein